MKLLIFFIFLNINITPFVCFDADDALRPDAQSCCSFFNRKVTLKYKKTRQH